MNSDLNRLKKQITDLSERVYKLENKNGALERTIKSQQSKINNLNKDLVDQQYIIQKLSSDIDYVESLVQ